ncbi:serine hydrolase [Flavobacterium sp. NST-5]|uniref:Serine hydrolase n=1 Tax=Flavobacterium ichthyis TaxID=2698827 RepID=A0ABW9Z840_9FLAO|nr:serine hydrolase [Flavobacterium ichthyis]NBL65042.1 serine hydrolase [Flavobacterium ichthyis]
MRFLLKFILWLLTIFVLLIVALYVFDVDYLIKGVRITYLNGEKTAYLSDYTEFDNRTIEKGVGQPWKISEQYNSVEATDSLTNLHKKFGTVAFMIIKNDSIWHESYFDGYGKNSKSNSFSMAKSMVTSAVGKAIMDGKIKSLDQKVTDFFPEYKGEFGSLVTVGDLASMASGLDWDESYYSPFSITTRAYFDENLNDMMLNLKFVSPPGKEFHYVSGNTQLLAMILEKATGQKLSDYVSENFWKPIGAENEALWQLDHQDGIEKAYCCVAASARDFARFGKLYLQNGVWNGEQILDSTFVKKSTTPRFADSPMYGYGWWLSDHLDKKIYYMQGHLGQYVIVIPEDELIIVRLGHNRDERADGKMHRQDFFTYIDETYKMLNAKK